MPHAHQRIDSVLRRLRRAAAVLALLAASVGAHADERRYYFDAHDSATRLAQHTVNAIFQDRAGYVWIATEGGVNAYDGYRYRLYEHHPDDPASLPDNFVTAIAEDGQKRIWLGSNNGSLAALDPESGKATTYALAPDAPNRERRRKVGALAFDRQHTLWLGTAAGIERVDSQTGKRSVVFEFASGPAETNVLDLIVATDGTVWAASSAGVLRIAPGSNRAEPVAAAAIGSAAALAIGKGGVLYAGTPGGLFRIDAAGNRGERLWPPDATAARAVRHIVQDDQGRLWLAAAPGLVVFDPATAHSEVLEHDHDMPGSLPENSVTALFADRSGLLWVGSATR